MGGASQPVQRLKKSEDVKFKGNLDKRSQSIFQNLDDYHKHRKEKAEDHQGRLRGLADLRGDLHAWFKENKGASLKDIPNGEELHDLYREIEAEHTQAIASIKDTEEAPIDTRGMEEHEIQDVQKLWKSIVGGTGNLKIGGDQDFQKERFADIALLLQKRDGRDLLRQVNADHGSEKMNVKVAPGFSKEELGNDPEPKGSYAFPISSEDARLKYDKNAEPKVDVKGGQVPQEITKMAFDNAKVPFTVDGGKGAYQFGKGSGSLVKIVPDDPNSHASDENLNFALSPRFLSLGHELGHAHKNLRGASFADPTASGEFFDQTGQDDLTRKLWSYDAEEVVNISSVENAIRDEHGLTPRKFHTDLKSARHEVGHKQLEDKLFKAWKKVPQNLKKRKEIDHPLSKLRDVLGSKDFSDPKAHKDLDDQITDFAKELPETIKRANLHQANDELEQARKKEVLFEDPDFDIDFKFDFGFLESLKDMFT